jgi:uncharacterized protein
MTENTPYHEGEKFVQEKLGVVDTARMNGRVINNTIPGGALNFIAQQSMVILGSVDTDEQVWASALFGTPGFIHAIDQHTIEINLLETGTGPSDPLWKNIETHNRIGMIVIELGSRRRLRVNGRMSKTSNDSYQIDIDQAYPNCPQYIQRRHINRAKKHSAHNITLGISGKELTDYQKKLISSADTFFVTSAHSERGVDASHRGGQPGFVNILNNTLLRIPDYPGNSMFNTLGNFQVNPHAGLVFIDFENKKLLQLSGQANVIWQVNDSEVVTAGTSRFWEFNITSWIESNIAFDIEWEYLDASPFNPKPYDDNKAEEKELLLTVEEITQQSDNIKSFKLISDNKQNLPEFDSGAHLQITLNKDSNQLVKHYSILSHPDNRHYYEIAVLNEPHGKGGSIHMHTQIKQGDTLLCSSPKNEFPISKDAEHSILIAGGIGITPMLSMLQKLTSQNKSVEIHYTVKHQTDFIFKDKIKKIAGEHSYFYASRDQGSRIDLATLMKKSEQGTHIYVCGPVRLINAVRDLGNENNWQDNHIHFESFGAQSNTNNKDIEIHLSKSDKTMTVPADKSILDYLLEQNIDVPHQCKRGECGLCITNVLKGEADHNDLCLDKETRKSSMCLCVSRAKNKSLTLEL